jgi:hypothetical protein
MFLGLANYYLPTAFHIKFYVFLSLPIVTDTVVVTPFILLRIRDISGSDLGLETDYPD